MHLERVIYTYSINILSAAHQNIYDVILLTAFVVDDLSIGA